MQALPQRPLNNISYVPLPIVLSVDRSAPSGKGIFVSKQDPAFEDAKNAAMTAQDSTCQFCSFRTPKYQDIIFKNGNGHDLTPENLLVACIFCHQCFHLEQITAMNSGVLIYLPEMSQMQLHHLTRAIYIARRTQGPVADAARAALTSLMGRKEEAKKRLGTDQPSVLAAVMQDLMDSKQYRQRNKRLEGIRLMPLDKRIVIDDDMEFDQFPQILAHWRSRHGPFGSMLPPTWPQLLQSFQSSKAA